MISAVVLKVIPLAQPLTSVTVTVWATSGVTSTSNDLFDSVHWIVWVAAPSKL